MYSFSFDRLFNLLNLRMWVIFTYVEYSSKYCICGACGDRSYRYDIPTVHWLTDNL